MQMKNKTITFLMLSLFLGTGCSASEFVPVSSEQQLQIKSIPETMTGNELNNNKEDNLDKEKSVAEQLARIKSEIVLLKAEAARAEARKQLEKVTGEKKSIDSEGEGLPLLKSIYGNGGNQLSAEFKYGPGDIVEAHAGTVLPGRFKVITITSTSAQLQDAKGNSHIINIQHAQERERENSVNERYFSSEIPAPRLR